MLHRDSSQISESLLGVFDLKQTNRYRVGSIQFNSNRFCESKERSIGEMCVTLTILDAIRPKILKNLPTSVTNSNTLIINRFRVG